MRFWLELGLQTANDKTLKRINRGHDFAVYETIHSGAPRALGIKVLYAPYRRPAKRNQSR